MSEFKLNYPVPDNQQVELTIESGQIIFIVGANGTGKSTLMHKFATQNKNRVRRITAHRQVWFNTNSIDITPAGREQTEKNISNTDQQTQSIWKDDYAAQRSQITIFDLIDSENVGARKIAEAARSGQMDAVKDLASVPAPMSKMNDILKISNLDVKIKIDKGSKLIAEGKGHQDYSIAELSDGERNAILMIANVLTVPKDTLILLDEPERHLHRSIVSPLLSTLLTYRDDCAFVISTHDVSLPLDQRKASSLLLRSYVHSPQHWVADYIEAVEEMDELTASAILGSRRKILFIEGSPSSLDIQIYQILFPNISIRPVGSCVNVERIVKGLRSMDGIHWVLALGIIDKDNRSDDECAKLEGDGIVPLEQYSVESIYYHPSVIQGVLNRSSEINGTDVSKAFDSLTNGIVKAIEEHKDRMAARIVEKRVKDKVLYECPSWKNILSNNSEITISTEEILNKEKQLIEELLKNKDIASLVARYPVRETPSFECVAKALGYRSHEKYEQAVRKMLLDIEEEKQKVLEMIKPISNLL
ncbi:ATP-binding cassette domain-containing protein [Candidatus Pacearchaeota archaeon]|nr:ATP-binding cassette domain-containing protein [Candidatus Pacearchaeota archaeon]